MQPSEPNGPETVMALSCGTALDEALDRIADGARALELRDCDLGADEVRRLCGALQRCTTVQAARMRGTPFVCVCLRACA